MARKHAEELFGIVEHQLVEPGAAVRHRVVMEADERVGAGLRRERHVEPREFLRVEVPAMKPGHGAVHHDDHPVAIAPREVVHEGRSVERRFHGGGIVMVAREAVHRRRGVAETLAQHRIAPGVVMREVAGQEHRIRPRMAALRMGDAARERRLGRHVLTRMPGVPGRCGSVNCSTRTSPQ